MRSLFKLFKKKRHYKNAGYSHSGQGSETVRLKVFSRRAFLVGASQGAILSVLGVRMAWLQIAQAEKYKTLAEENRINVVMISPERGLITDRNGVLLASNARIYRAVMIPEQVKDINASLRKLKKYLPITDKHISNVIKQAGRTSRFVPIEIISNLSWTDVSKVEAHRHLLPGIFIEAGTSRNYPFKEPTAHLVGYVGRVSEKELSGNAVELLPGYKIGKTGLEKYYNDSLKGRPGQRDVEVNAVGREVRDLNTQDQHTGEQISLTIDAELQRFLQQRLAQEKSAAAVLMDAHTGAIYGLGSHPSFDPNLFVDGISFQAYNELLHNETHPLTNKAVTGQYPPGSTFKMITLLAGLETGVITSGTTIKCSGHYTLGKGKFHCWKTRGHGRMNITQALAQSCDVFFYETVNEIGIDKVMEVAKRFGLGQDFGLPLPEEKAGFLPSKEWKKRRFNEKWQPGESVVHSIGQGFTLATPLQLATMTARLVNGGKAVEPWLTAFKNGQSQTKTNWPQMAVKTEHLNIIKKGMDNVITGEEGTARGAKIPDPAYSFGGKTGTSQVTRITQAQRAKGVRKQEDIEWNLRHHALFVGYAPLNNPRYTCGVIVEHGGSGSSAAAPLAKDLLWEIQKRNPAEKPYSATIQEPEKT